MLRILHVVSWYTPSGAARLDAGIFHNEQVAAMQGICDTAIYWPFDTTLSAVFSKAEEWGVQTYRSVFKPKRYLMNMRTIKSCGAKVVDDFKPDIIHAHVASSAGIYAAHLAKRHGIPLVITEHLPPAMSGVERKGLRRFLCNRVYRQSRANLGVSPYMQRALQQYFPKREFGMIPNPVQAPQCEAVSNASLRAVGQANAAIVGSFYNETVKGYQYLLPALARLKERGLPLHLHIVGGGQFLPTYQKLASNLGLQDQTTFYGALAKQDVYKVIGQMDFCVSASLAESAGIFAEEAMMLGKPLVVTKSGGTDSLVTPDTAIVVERGSSEALEKGLEEMMSSSSYFDAEIIHAYAKTHFDMHAVNRKYIQIYERVLKSSP